MNPCRIWGVHLLCLDTSLGERTVIAIYTIMYVPLTDWYLQMVFFEILDLRKHSLKFECRSWPDLHRISLIFLLYSSFNSSFKSWNPHILGGNPRISYVNPWVNPQMMRISLNPWIYQIYLGIFKFSLFDLICLSL